MAGRRCRVITICFAVSLLLVTLLNIGTGLKNVSEKNAMWSVHESDHQSDYQSDHQSDHQSDQSEWFSQSHSLEMCEMRGRDVPREVSRVPEVVQDRRSVSVGGCPRRTTAGWSSCSQDWSHADRNGNKCDVRASVNTEISHYDTTEHYGSLSACKQFASENNFTSFKYNRGRKYCLLTYGGTRAHCPLGSFVDLGLNIGYPYDVYQCVPGGGRKKRDPVGSKMKWSNDSIDDDHLKNDDL